MSQENKAAVRRFIALLNEKRLADLGDVCDEDFVFRGSGGLADVHGLGAFKQTLQSFFDAFPDLEDTIEDMIAEGDLVAGRFTARGTHQGDFAGVSPTGTRVSFQGINMYRVRDGKIVEEWFQEDLLGLMQQLRAISAPGRPSAN